MSTTKVTDLTELTSAADDDVLLISDVDAALSKKIQKSNITEQNFTTALKTKLDGVETGATADQTGAEIKTAYEGESDTNAFTDAEKTKLSGIETGATADQTAGEIKTAYESNSDTNAFTDAEQTKLSGIETGADVTDTTNVVAALTAGTNITIAGDGTISATDTDTGILNVSEDTTPQLGGDLDTNGNNINFGDGDYAYFGDSNDLQIYHDGSASFIRDVGTGDLNLSGNEVRILNAGQNEAKAIFTSDGACDLYYDNASRLATTADGVDINGTGALKLPVGTTAQQPASPTAGDLRWNSDDTSAEIYDGSAWGAVGGGGAAETPYAEHSNNITSAYSIASGNNAVSGGPITVGTGGSVTVPSGSVWTIV